MKIIDLIAEMRSKLVLEREKLLDQAVQIDEAVRVLNTLDPNVPKAAKTSRATKKGHRKFKHPRLAKKHISKGVKGYWASMTPDERSAEVKRRRAVARKKRG